MNWEEVAGGGWPENEAFANLSSKEKVSELDAAARMAAARQSNAPEETHRLASAALHLLDAQNLDEAGLRATFGCLLAVAEAALGRTETAVLQLRHVIEGPFDRRTESVKTQARIALGGLLTRSNPQEATRLLRRATADATRLGDLSFVANASITLGAILRQAGDHQGARLTYENAITAISNSLHQSQTGSHGSILARLHGNLANLLTDNFALHDEAIQHYITAVRLFQEVGDARHAAQRWCQLVDTTLQAGHFERAIALFDNADDHLAHAPDSLISFIGEARWLAADEDQRASWESAFIRVFNSFDGERAVDVQASLIAARIALCASRNDLRGVIELADDERIRRLPDSRLRDLITSHITEVSERIKRLGLCWHLPWIIDSADYSFRLEVRAHHILEQATLWLAKQVRRWRIEGGDLAEQAERATTQPSIAGLASVPDSPPDWLEFNDPIDAAMFSRLRRALCPPLEDVSSRFFEIHSAATDARGNPKPGSAELLERAIPLSDLLGQPQLQVATRLLLAQAIADRDDGATKTTFPICHSLIQQALSLSEGISREQIRVLITLGTLFKEARFGDEASRLDAAISELIRARALAQEDNLPGLIATIAVGLGNALAEYPTPSWEQLETARRYLEEGLAALEREPDEPLSGVIHNSLGKVYLQLSEFEGCEQNLDFARRHLLEAVSIRNTERDPVRLLVTLGNLLGVLIRSREAGIPTADSETTALGNRIREVAARVPSRRVRCRALLNAVVALRRANPADALPLGLDALSLARQDGVTRELVDACLSVGQVYSLLDDHRQAIRVFQEGVSVLEAFREEGGDSEYRAGLARNYRLLHDRLIDSLQAIDAPASELWSAVERCAGRTLIENMARQGLLANESSGVIDALTAHLPEQSVVLQLYQAGTEIRCLVLRVANRALDVRLCASRLALLAFGSETMTPTTANDEHGLRLYTPAFHDGFERQLAWVGKQFIEPLLDEVDPQSAKRIVIAAQGLAASFAWHAMPLSGGDSRLADRFDVVQVPNVSILSRLLSQPSRRLEKAVFVACDPTRTLSRHVEETREAFSMLETQEKIVLTDTSRPITSESFLDACQDVDLLHFSGHSQLTPGDMEHSGLVLSNGILTVPMLERAISSRPPAVVVLSSCDSAAEDLYLTDVPTLATAFLQAGVGSVIGAAWPVPDDIAAETMRPFYALLAKSGAIASLNAARRQLGTAITHGYAHSFKVMGWD